MVEALLLTAVTVATLLAAASVLGGAPAADGACGAGEAAGVEVTVTWFWDGSVRTRTEALGVVDLWPADVAAPRTGTPRTAVHVDDDGWPVRVVPPPLEAGVSAWLVRGAAATGLLVLGGLLRRLVVRCAVRSRARSWQRPFDRWRWDDHGSPHRG